MSVVWAVLLLLPPVLAIGLLARRLHQARAHAARVEARLAAVLAAAGSGLSVWTAEGRLAACNARFRELYPGVPIKPGLELEDLLRLTAARGLVQVAEDDTEAWVQARLTGVRGGERTRRAHCGPPLPGAAGGARGRRRDAAAVHRRHGGGGDARRAGGTGPAARQAGRPTWSCCAA